MNYKAQSDKEFLHLVKKLVKKKYSISQNIICTHLKNVPIIFDLISGSDPISTSLAGFTVYKMRVASGNTGKSGGFRVYFYVPKNLSSIIMFAIHPKKGSMGQSSIPPQSIKALLIQHVKNLQAGEVVQDYCPQKCQQEDDNSYALSA